MYQTDELQKKWQPVLEHTDLPEIADAHKRSTVATLLENQERAAAEQSAQSGGAFAPSLLGEAAPANATGNSVDNFDPVLISLVRRSMPNLIAYDIAGVQPMTGPTGLIFAMRSRYSAQGGAEALFGEADTGFGSSASGNTASVDTVGTGVGGRAAGAVAGTDPTGTYTVATGMDTADAEKLGDTANNGFNEMAFSIEKVAVTAVSRALKAEYTMELAQDLKAVHGLDAEAELANILSAEILGEINREVIQQINTQAKVGGAGTGAGIIALADATDNGGGRWQAERFQALAFRLEQEANTIAKETRRGKGNYVICSSSVAAALSAAGALAYGSGITDGSLVVDNAGNTFAGTLKNGMKVYVDPYAGYEYATVGYKGTNSYDAGIYYCPYVPLTQLKAVNAGTFQPKVGFKTRYGLVSNPFAVESDAAITENLGTVGAGTNPYFRRNLITGV